MRGHVIFLNGPVGVGKSTLGRALAGRLGGVFLDGDDFSDPDRPWYSCILQTGRRIVQAGMDAIDQSRVAVVAHPLRRTEWVFFKRSFEDRGVSTVFVNLRASCDSILDAGRGRVFTANERDRIRVMIAEGYSARPFCDLTVDTDAAGFAETLGVLETKVRQQISH